MAYSITSQAEIRRMFWDTFTVERRRIPDHSGRGTMHTADARMAFVDFVDHLARDGDISPALAQRATLD